MSGVTDESSWGNLPTWTTVSIQPNTDTIWMETGMNRSSQWPELRVFCLVDHSCGLAINPLHSQWSCSKEINPMTWTIIRS